MLADGLREGAEDDAEVLQLALEGGGHGDAVEYRVHRHAGENRLFLQRDTELGVGLQELRIDLVEALGAVFPGLGRRIIDDVVVVDLGVVNVGPGGLFEGEPMPISLETPLEQPLRLFLLGGNQADDVLIQAAGDGVGSNIGDESPLIFLIRKGLDRLRGIAHRDGLLNCWADTTLANPYFLVKIAHLMDARRGRMGAEEGRNVAEVSEVPGFPHCGAAFQAGVASGEGL